MCTHVPSTTKTYSLQDNKKKTNSQKFMFLQICRQDLKQSHTFDLPPLPKTNTIKFNGPNSLSTKSVSEYKLISKLQIKSVRFNPPSMNEHRTHFKPKCLYIIIPNKLHNILALLQARIYEEKLQILISYAGVDNTHSASQYSCSIRRKNSCSKPFSPFLYSLNYIFFTH